MNWLSRAAQGIHTKRDTEHSPPRAALGPELAGPASHLPHKGADRHCPREKELAERTTRGRQRQQPDPGLPTPVQGPKKAPESLLFFSLIVTVPLFVQQQKLKKMASWLECLTDRRAQNTSGNASHFRLQRAVLISGKTCSFPSAQTHGA